MVPVPPHIVEFMQGPLFYNARNSGVNRYDAVGSNLLMVQRIQNGSRPVSVAGSGESRRSRGGTF